jgi:hypothetical protein
MDSQTPLRAARFEESQDLFSTPLSSPPSHIALPSSPPNIAMNASYTVDNGFQATDIYLSDEDGDSDEYDQDRSFQSTQDPRR